MYQMLMKKGPWCTHKIQFHLFKPGLRWLEDKFKKKQQIKLDERNRIQSAIDRAIRNKPVTWEAFMAALRLEKIELLPYINQEGYSYGTQCC